MTEEIRYIANLQRQEEFDNEVTELKDALKRLEQENENLKKEVKQIGSDFIKKGDYARELEQERDDLKKTVEARENELANMAKEANLRIDELKQENKELKEWKTKVVKLFESACRCKYLNEETDICSYTNEKCININKCVYKYQELSDTYRSALEEIRRIAEDVESASSIRFYRIKNKITRLYND